MCYYHLCFTNLKVWYAEAYSEPCGASRIEFFEKVVKGFHALTAFAKFSILDVRWGSGYTFGYTGLSVATKIELS